MGKHNKATAGLQIIRRRCRLEIAIFSTKGTATTKGIAQGISAFFPEQAIFYERGNRFDIHLLLIDQGIYDFSCPASRLFLCAILKKHAVGTTKVCLECFFSHNCLNVSP